MYLLIGIGRPDVRQGGRWAGAVQCGWGRGVVLAQPSPSVRIHRLHKDAQQSTRGYLCGLKGKHWLRKCVCVNVNACACVRA